MSIRAVLLGSALYCLSYGLASADYYEQLKVIEKERLSDLAGTESSLNEISKNKQDFSNEETHLYLLLKAHSETMQSNFAEAEELLLRIINSDASIDYKGRAHSILAAVLQIQGKYVRSYVHLDKAMGYAPRMDNKEYKANILQNAVSFYNDSGMIDYAMVHARRLLKLGIQTKDLSHQCQAYFEMMVIELSANKYELAADRLTRTDDICSKANESLFLLHLPNVKAELAIQKGNTSMAKKLLEENYSEVKNYGWKILNASTEIRLANVYSILGELQKAEKLALKALKISQEIGDIKRSKGATEILAKVYSKLGEKDKAIKYFQRYMELEKRLSASSRQRKLAYDQARQWIRARQIAKVD